MTVPFTGWGFFISSAYLTSPSTRVLGRDPSPTFPALIQHLPQNCVRDPSVPLSSIPIHSFSQDPYPSPSGDLPREGPLPPCPLLRRSVQTPPPVVPSGLSPSSLSRQQLPPLALTTHSALKLCSHWLSVRRPHLSFPLFFHCVPPALPAEGHLLSDLAGGSHLSPSSIPFSTPHGLSRLDRYFQTYGLTLPPTKKL